MSGADRSGLPEALPPGDHILWQGRPRWTAMAMYAFHAREVAIYFGVLVVGQAVYGLIAGRGVAGLNAVAWTLLPGLISLALLSGLAYLASRTTRYTITSQRLVMQFGIALPLTLNIPFKLISSAGLKVHQDGTGDIPVTVEGERRAAYLLLWPHARPWRLARAEPMLRCVPGVKRVAEILAQALAAQSPAERPATSRSEPAVATAEVAAVSAAA